MGLASVRVPTEAARLPHSWRQMQSWVALGAGTERKDILVPRAEGQKTLLPTNWVTYASVPTFLGQVSCKTVRMIPADFLHRVWRI